MFHSLAPFTLMTRCDTGFLIVLPLHTQRIGCYAKQRALRSSVQRQIYCILALRPDGAQPDKKNANSS